MSTIAAIVLGILIGLLIEWVIDWIYWRKKGQNTAAVKLTDKISENNALLRENALLKNQLEKLTSMPDDLKVIKGIGPEIEHRLNEAGILTFAQLGQLTRADLERILGDVIKRLANEESLLEQARELADLKK